MGACIATNKKKSVKPPKPKPIQVTFKVLTVILLGVDNAGKTTITQCLKGGELALFFCGYGYCYCYCCYEF